MLKNDNPPKVIDDNVADYIFRGSPAPWYSDNLKLDAPKLIVNSHNISITDAREVGKDVSVANTRLMCSAPDLLEAYIDRDQGQTRTVGKSLQTLAFLLKETDIENKEEWIDFLNRAGKKMHNAVHKALNIK